MATLQELLEARKKAQAETNQYSSILLHITCFLFNIELGITHYYSILHGHYNITQGHESRLTVSVAAEWLLA